MPYLKIGHATRHEALGHDTPDMAQAAVLHDMHVMHNQLGDVKLVAYWEEAFCSSLSALPAVFSQSMAEDPGLQQLFDALLVPFRAWIEKQQDEPLRAFGDQCSELISAGAQE